jgi:hypothetical protein
MVTRQFAAMVLILSAVCLAAPAHAACIAIGNAYQCGTSYYVYDYYYGYLLLRERMYLGYPVGYPTPFSGPGWIYRRRR